MTTMSATDEVLAEALQAWIRHELPNHEDLVEQMTQLAMSYRHSGATVEETCEWSQLLVSSWLRHPSSSEPCARHLHLLPGGGEG